MAEPARVATLRRMRVHRALSGTLSSSRQSLLRNFGRSLDLASRLGPLAFLALALGGAAGCKKSQAQTKGSPGSPGSGWYDDKPLQASLRPAARIGIEKAVGVGSLSELPLYDLSLSLDTDKRTFRLGEEIWFTNRESKPLSEVVLRIYANSSEGGAAKKGKPLVSLSKGTCTGSTCTVAMDGLSTIVVRPVSPVAPGGHLRIQLDLSGTLDEIDDSRTNVFAQTLESLTMLGGGESAGNYGLLAQGDGISSMANFYAVLARRRDDVWEKTDESAIGDLGSDEMANVHARIEVPAGTTVVTSGVTVSDKAVAGKKLVEVDAALVRDFALVASADFAIESATVGDVEVRAFYLTKEKKAGSKVLDTAKWALEDYEKRFGPYPYADLDVVEAPLIGGAGGVEFAGLVTIASMFYRPPLPDSGLGGMLGGLLPKAPGGGGADGMMDGMMNTMLEFVTAHEVAHQYWHGLVGSDSRLHPYLDESLAQWTAMLYLEDRYGVERAKKDGDLNVAMNFQALRLMGKKDAPVDRPASDFGDMVTYAGLVYGKAPYLWSAMRKELGDAAFFSAMRTYVDTYRLRLAPPRALIDTFAAAVPGDPTKATKVRALAKRWLDEAHGDEDLGKLDLFELVGPMLGIDAKDIDPTMKKLVEDLLLGDHGLLQNLLGDDDGKGGGGLGLGGDDGLPNLDPKDVEELMKQLMAGDE